MFSRNIPIRAMITVVPAKSTARPAVSTARIAASCGSSPSSRLLRKRVTMKSA